MSIAAAVDSSAAAARSRIAIVRRCGGSGGHIPAGVRGNLDRRLRRGGGDDLGRHDVLVPGQGLEVASRARRLRTHRQVPRLPGMSGVRSAPADGAAASQVLFWTCRRCGWTNRITDTRCQFCSAWKPSSLSGSHLRAALTARAALASVASPAGPRARARDVSARYDQLRVNGACSRPPAVRAQAPGAGASYRADTSRSRPARVPIADGRDPGEPRGLRRAGQALVRARAARGGA